MSKKIEDVLAEEGAAAENARLASGRVGPSWPHSPLRSAQVRYKGLADGEDKD